MIIPFAHCASDSRRLEVEPPDQVDEEEREEESSVTAAARGNLPVEALEPVDDEGDEEERTVTTSENDIVPATSHWSFAKVTVKTVTKKSASTTGARSAAARGRSRASAVTAARHGTAAIGASAGRLELEPGLEPRAAGLARPSSLPARSARSRRRAPSSARIRPRAPPRRRSRRPGPAPAAPRPRAVVSRRPKTRSSAAVSPGGALRRSRPGREPRAVGRDDERIAEQRHDDDRRRREPGRRAAHGSLSRVVARPSRASSGIADAARMTIAAV